MPDSGTSIALTVPPSKVCTGPAHPGPVSLPLNEENWYFHKSGPRQGLPLSRCKLCVNFNRLQSTPGVAGTVDCKKVFKYVQELILRYETAEAAARATGLAAATLRSIMVKDYCTVQKRTALKIITALDNKRREDRRAGKVSKKFLDAKRNQALAEGRVERQLDN